MNKGKITIGRSSGGSKERRMRPIHIEVTDETSRTEFLEIHMSLEDFASALTGHGYMDCWFDLRSKNVGKIRETKTELVPVSKEDRYSSYSSHPEIAKRILAPYEVDGWKGHSGDMFNHHRMKGDGYLVSFTRFVDPPISPSDPVPVSLPSDANKTAAAATGEAKKGVS